MQGKGEDEDCGLSILGPFGQRKCSIKNCKHWAWTEITHKLRTNYAVTQIMEIMQNYAQITHKLRNLRINYNPLQKSIENVARSNIGSESKQLFLRLGGFGVVNTWST